MPDARGREAMQFLADMGIVGGSPAFAECLDQVVRFAHARAPVLIEGETGTGKDSIARALHYFGPRRHKPFVPVDCGALPEGIFENEFYGHRQGAYTDAKTHQPGLVAQAHDGTLFLDEIDGLGPRPQASLLRFLQDQTYRRLGDTSYQRADVQLIVATNKHLEEEVEKGTFRKDLFFRIQTALIRVPPLRDRPGDIGLMAHRMLARLNALYECEVPKCLSSESLDWLERQPWPGNIRELQNMLHRRFLLSDSETIEIHGREHERMPLLQLSAGALHGPYDEIRRAVLRDFERQYLHHLMEAAQGNVSRAAQIAVKDRRSLGRLLARHRIDRRSFSPAR